MLYAVFIFIAAGLMLTGERWYIFEKNNEKEIENLSILTFLRQKISCSIELFHFKNILFPDHHTTNCCAKVSIYMHAHNHQYNLMLSKKYHEAVGDFFCFK